MSNKKNEMTFYSTRGILLMIVFVVVLAVIALVGLYLLGIIKMPSFITDIIDTPVETSAAPPAANIASDDGTADEFELLLKRDEYAKALAYISFPDEYYHNYTISWFSGETSREVDYIAIYKNGDWWVQAEENDVIMSTVICKDGMLQFNDNADNSSITYKAADVEFTEYFGYMPLENIIGIIDSLANGNSVEYGGGIIDFSLSFTPALGTAENIFGFSFKRKDGISEEYSFAFESASIISIDRYNSNGEKIYQMKMKDTRNSLEDIDVDSLFTFTNND